MSEIEINKGDLQKHIDDYLKVRGHYEEFRKKLERILNKIKDEYAPLGIVQTRIKSVDGFAEKVMRKQKYEKPEEEITDLCGGRIIVHFQSEVDLICQRIRREFQIDEKNCIDKRDVMKTSEFGYVSVHLIVSPKRKIMGVKFNNDLIKKKAEVQIKTFLQHAWADISHDRIYKAAIKVPAYWERESYRLAAILEEADKSFLSFAQTLDAFASNYAAVLNKERFEKTRSRFETLYQNAKDKCRGNGPDFKKWKRSAMKYAFELTKLHCIKRDWHEVEKLLNDYKGESQKINMLLGYVQCMLGIDGTEEKFNEGIKLLEKLARPEKKIKRISAYDYKIKDKDKEENELQKHRRARALYLLGECYIRKNDIEMALKCFDLAYNLVPANPYYLTNYLECKIAHDKKQGSILKPAVRDAIEKCQEHIQYQLEMPDCYWTIGKLFLIIGDIDQSLNAYAKAIDFCNNENPIFPIEIFDDQLASLDRINNEDIEEIDYQVIRFLLLLGKYNHIEAKDNYQIRAEIKKNLHTSEALGDLEFLKKDPEYLKRSTVLIVAGGAEFLENAAAYRKLLNNALENYQGIIISGGTRQGIPGQVGAIVGAINNNRLKKKEPVYLLGYYPEGIDEKLKDQNYIPICINQKTFSILDMIQYWIDLVLNDVNFDRVNVLGINGGRFSDLEYRIALAMGVQVGLIENSGRAVTGILSDPDWMGHQHIVVIPEKEILVWAFVNQYQNQVISDEIIDEVQEHVHECYRKYKYDNGLSSDSTMKPWEKLIADKTKELEDLKISNAEQVRFIEPTLKRVGSVIKDERKLDIDWDEFENKKEELAECEHARWWIERLAEGWKYGEKRDDLKKTNPFLVEWDKLDDMVKEYDRVMINNWIKILEKIKEKKVGR
ncbi:hypothetical protein JW835_06980 [bacterium]|nr:hypothetical protein [bacterium]